ncbi:MAG: NUDIX hydrolase [Planctomycetota bacterium]
MTEGPERLARRTLHTGRIFQLVHDRVRLASGREQHVDVVLHPGAVAIAPRLDDGSFVAVRQYRHPVEADLLEFPAGRLEAGEDPLACARRELAEETGYAAENWRSLGDVLVAPGWTTERIHLFVAEGLTRLASPPPADDDEEIQIVELEPAALWRSTNDAKTLVALARLGFAQIT